jgi:hypothetical protein
MATPAVAGRGAGWRRGRPGGHDATVSPPPDDDPAPDPEVTAPVDPVLARRAQVARAAELAQRLGYALFAVAVVAFVVGFAVGFDGLVVAIVVGAMGVGSVALAPAIVAGYAVKAADRDDRERGILP